ncbi:hypothetical protein QNO07_03805 [Streptomyces sp. 549]|uniref:hypothetical protein n=1 Tax=Streptomyces sp. 549 TaxID=3049076 RepID=UPI0024C3A890|nr:hypothetical protein [Streptomyces sp. 549]MDK1472560.1 hypothetical protein [Streptomyces sp. 549]
MTAHSGQGDEPREGIVLPSNGEPWFPGRQETPPVSPPAGQPWDRPWGPAADEASDAAQGPGAPGAGTPVPPRPPHAPPHQPPAPQTPPAPTAGPLPDYASPDHQPNAPSAYGGSPSAAEETQMLPPQPSDPGTAAPGQGAYGQSGYGQSGYGRGGYGQDGYGQDGYGGQGGYGGQSGSYGGQARHGQDQFHQNPYRQDEYQQDQFTSGGHGGHTVHSDSGYGQGGHRQGGHGRHSADAYPQAAPPGEFGPPPADADATQLIPPQGAADADATQLIPPQGAADADATQFIPPYADGPAAPAGPEAARRPLPPEAPAGGPPESAGSAYSGADSADLPAGPAYGMRPGTPGERPPPAEFDNLFRPDPGAGAGGGAASSTQQLPQIGEAVSRPRPAGRGGPGGPAGERPQPTSRGRGRPSGERKKPSPVLLGGLGVLGIVVAGLIGGAALGGGDDSSGDGTPAARTGEPSAAPEEQEEQEETEAPVDPVEEQAKALDTLLADSNNSREAVIRSVESIRKCENLGTAAKDLRDAADQRNDLVTRLGELDIAQLPDHRKLAAELTKAWKASAAADDHYADWAEQVDSPKGCRGGQARSTKAQARGNRASGEATAAKQKAADLWNPVARKYDLDERQPTQL